MLMKYEAQWGETILGAAKASIALAAKHNCRVELSFNGVKLRINKRLSGQHIRSTYRRMLDASAARHQKSPEGLAQKARWDAELWAMCQAMESLMVDMPRTKTEALDWMAKYAPLAEVSGVNTHPQEVISAFKELGFQKDQHVGDPKFCVRGPGRSLKRIEFLAGQMMDMLEKRGHTHQIIGIIANEMLS